MVEHHRRGLKHMMALHSANAPISAARLLDRNQAHVLEALAWALDDPPPPAMHAYADVLWRCMPLLQPRLDTAQRLALCEVRLLRQLDAFRSASLCPNKPSTASSEDMAFPRSLFVNVKLAQCLLKCSALWSPSIFFPGHDRHRHICRQCGRRRRQQSSAQSSVRRCASKAAR